ncbi:MAG: 5-(carboxyamino)imidazole ribonucleotide synthase [Gemmatimonadales bacterium]|nr:5-(carboxyamino)imidazole ribonucleotide synthase [Gemmatimonadales bacterium]
MARGRARARRGDHPAPPRRRMILPGATLGVLGGGQLGRMFTMRAREMGYRVIVHDPDPESPAGACGDDQIRAPYDDTDALDHLASRCRAVTTEFENVPAAAMERLAARVRVRPGPAAVAIAQDRIAEKSFLQAHGFATAAFAPVGSGGEAADAFRAIAAPACLLKTARLGYDGKGQATVRSPDEAREAWEALGRVPCVLERRLDLEREASVVLARGDDGAAVAFPPGENVHVGGILHTTTVPATLDDETRTAALSLALRVAEALEYVGVLGVELFVADGGRLYVNELAPRPHNSGHWTLDAASVDQFELQVRALCGLPLPTPHLLSPVSMVNILGDAWDDAAPDWGSALALPGVKLHLYGKRVPRAGRKMGHLNCLAASGPEALALALEAHRRLRIP